MFLIFFYFVIQYFVIQKVLSEKQKTEKKLKCALNRKNFSAFSKLINIIS